MRQYLANLRSNLRSFIQRAQRNAAGKAATGAAGGTAGALAANNRPAAGQCLVLLVALHMHIELCLSALADDTFQ